MSATVVRAFAPNAPAATVGLIPGITVVERTDSSRATRRVLVSTFQPRTSTSPAPSAPVTTARRESRLSPYSRTIGFLAARVVGEGAEEAGFGLVNCSTPRSSTRTCAPLSAARCWRNSQSETLGWVSCLYVIGAASTLPQASPAPAATLRTMSAVFMFRYATTFPAALEPVRLGQGADDGERPGGVVVQLDRRDLPGEQPLRGPGPAR
ncbi:hypothetical protein SMICM304S_05428 [Streptomyces microflavus]